MAENKKSFILYADLIGTVKKLPKEKAGELFLHILEYVNDLNPVTEDLLIEVAFEPIKLALKRDLKKYEKYIEKQRENGLKGGRPLKSETQKTQPFFTEPKKADSVNDSVSVNEIIIDNREINFVLDFWGFSIENKNHINHQRDVLAFLKTIPDKKYFFEQFNAYKQVKIKNTVYKHSLKNFIGDQSSKFTNGKWIEINWIEKLKEIDNNEPKGYTPKLTN